VVTGPGDEWLAASRSRMRAADSEREQVIDALKTAFAQGSLAKHELELRVGQTLASRTYAELAAILAGIPAPPARPAAAPREVPRPPARPSTRKVAISCACAVLAAELVLSVLVITIPLFLMLDLAVLVNLLGLPLAGGLVLDTWRENRGRGQLPPPVPPHAWMTVSAFDCISSSHWRPDWRP